MLDIMAPIFLMEKLTQGKFFKLPSQKAKKT